MDFFEKNDMNADEKLRTLRSQLHSLQSLETQEAKARNNGDARHLAACQAGWRRVIARVNRLGFRVGRTPSTRAEGLPKNTGNTQDAESALTTQVEDLGDQVATSVGVDAGHSREDSGMRVVIRNGKKYKLVDGFLAQLSPPFEILAASADEIDSARPLYSMPNDGYLYR